MHKHLLIFCLIVFIPQLYSQTEFRDSIDILNYAIHLDLSKTTTKQIHGKTEIKLKPVYELSSIKLDLEGLTTDSVLIYGKKMKFTHRGGLLNIFANQKLTSSDTMYVLVYYHGFPIKDKSWGGFFIDDGYAFNFGIGMAADPPNYGRVWFPCNDSFTDRAYYEYFITTAPNHVAACPGLLESETKLPDGKKLFHWKLNQNIPTYLSSVAVAEYNVFKDTVKGIERIIPIEIYSIAAEKQIKKTFANVKEFLHAFEYRFGPYKWDKIGYVSTNYWAGAMEHATNIAYSNYCDGSTSCESTLAHEFSHHWFGDLVTCSSEKDMWLNEGWASHAEAIYYEYADGKQAYKNYIRANHNDVIKYALNNLFDFGSLYGMPHSNTYGTVVYNKGADIAHTLRGQLGDNLFFSALKQYFIDYAFKNISVEQFKNYLSKQTKTDLTDFFDFWIYSSDFPHFSIHNVKIKPAKNKYQLDLTINQELLLNTGKFLNSCMIEIGILDKDLNLKIYNIKQTGKSSTHQLLLENEPQLILLDPDEKISDAVTDEYLVINKSSIYQFETQDIDLDINSLTSPVFCQVAYHWVSPGALKVGNKLKSIDSKYWEINYYSKDEVKAGANFYFNSEIYENQQNCCLLFRSDSDSEWTILNSKPEINSMKATFKVSEIKSGQYAIGLKE